MSVVVIYSAVCPIMSLLVAVTSLGKPVTKTNHSARRRDTINGVSNIGVINGCGGRGGGSGGGGGSAAGNRLAAAGDVRVGESTAPSGDHCCPGRTGGGCNECSGMMNVLQKCPCICSGVLPPRLALTVWVAGSLKQDVPSG